MSEPAEADRTARSVRRKSHRTRGTRRTLGFLSDWWVELCAILFVALGVFLVFERMQIRQTVLRWIQQAIQVLGGSASSLVRRLVQLAARATLSDIVGIVLLLAAGVLALRRTRWRLMSMSRFTDRLCPRCGSELHRIHRRWYDRVLNAFVPVRRYRCRNRDCGWVGLRTGRSRHE